MSPSPSSRSEEAMSSAEQQSYYGGCRSQSLPRGGFRDGRRDRQHHRRVANALPSPPIRPPPRAGRGHHRRLLDIDAVSRRTSSTRRKRATAAAIDELIDGTYFTIIAGTQKASPVYPRRRTTARASAATRAAAMRAVDGLRPNGGTAMGTWLAHVRDNRRTAPSSAHPRDPAHRRQGRARDTRTAPRRDRPQRRRIHLRLPRSRHRLARRGAARDLLGTAGHRRHRRGPR